MPTRIVIRTARPSATLEEERHGGRIGSPANRHDSMEESSRRRSTNKKTPIQRGVVGFRSSVREESSSSLRNRRDNDNLHLSSNDLRASPRLQGYLYMLVSSIVMLYSAVSFYMVRDDSETVKVVRRQEEGDDPDAGSSDFIQTFGGMVLSWKLYGAIVVSAAGVGISLFVLLVHFDSVCFPRLWKAMFRDGSKSELCLLLLLLVFWMGGLHICTSSFSVGEVAPNVYFTTWIAFASVAMNVGVWRTSADLPLITEMVKSHARETMYSWFCVLLFSMVTSLSIAELYANREELEFLVRGELQKVPQEEWYKGLGVSFSAVGVSALNLFCNYYFAEPLRFKVCRGGTTLNLDWRQVEGFLALLLMVVFSWFVFEYTGVNGALSGPSNPYFGSWGVWFCSIFTFGTWLRENKHIEMFMRE